MNRYLTSTELMARWDCSLVELVEWGIFRGLTVYGPDGGLLVPHPFYVVPNEDFTRFTGRATGADTPENRNKWADLYRTGDAARIWRATAGTPSGVSYDVFRTARYSRESILQIESMPDFPGTIHGDVASESRPTYSFFKDGDSWYVGPAGDESPFNHTVGFERIHKLLEGSNREIHSDDLGAHRSRVKASISDAIGKIAAAQPNIGNHLQHSVRFGNYIAYRPEIYIAWQLTKPA